MVLTFEYPLFVSAKRVSKENLGKLKNAIKNHRKELSQNRFQGVTPRTLWNFIPRRQSLHHITKPFRPIELYGKSRSRNTSPT